MKKVMITVCCMVLGVIAIVSFIGCETIDGGGALTVSPAAVTMGDSNGVKTVTFTVGGTTTDTNGNTVVVGGVGELSVPMTWAVTQPTLGHISTVAGNQAVYISSGGKGVNVVTVKDQYGAQGVATVTQL
jgi:hypothetical protein